MSSSSTIDPPSRRVLSHATPPRVVRADRLRVATGDLWSRLPWIGLVVGAIGVAASLLLRGSNPKQFHFSWLTAFLYCLSIALGGLFFVLVHHATRAGWGVVVRRLAENTMGTLPLFVLLFLPVVWGMHELFHWSHAEELAHDPLLAGKQPYLDPMFFLVRAGIFLVAWSALAWWYRGSSLRQDDSGDPAITRRLGAASGPALIVFALTVTFAAFDWAMSLDPHWYSTIFGVYYFAGCLVGFFAFAVLLAASLARSGEIRNVITVEHFHDLGKLLFAFTVFWAYIAFSQFFLIWYANIPEETAWYLHRLEGGWKGLSLLLAAGHFIVPFFFLMPRTIKRRTGLLALGAGWMLLMHLLDLYWLVMPNLHKHTPHPHVLDLTTLVGVGGLFVGALAWALRGHAVVPIRDPRLAESLGFENH